MHFGDETFQVSHDRSSAHFAAWYSPKREPEKVGEHFKPEDLRWCCFRGVQGLIRWLWLDTSLKSWMRMMAQDARVWMRLHFWAARETGWLSDRHHRWVPS